MLVNKNGEKLTKQSTSNNMTGTMIKPTFCGQIQNPEINEFRLQNEELCKLTLSKAVGIL